MCLAIYKDEGVEIPENHLRNAFAKNDDGAGFVVLRKGVLIAQKGFFKIEDFLKAYKPFAGYQALVHFRIGTSGGISKKNCHPFQVCHDTWMVHNGVLKHRTTQHRSDTRCFVEDVLRKAPRAIWDKSELEKLEKHIGTFNKMCFLRADGEYVIANEWQGYWNKEKNIWYSNLSYQDVQYYSCASGYDTSKRVTYVQIRDEFGQTHWVPESENPRRKRMGFQSGTPNHSRYYPEYDDYDDYWENPDATPIQPQSQSVIRAIPDKKTEDDAKLRGLANSLKDMINNDSLDIDQETRDEIRKAIEEDERERLSIKEAIADKPERKRPQKLLVPPNYQDPYFFVHDEEHLRIILGELYPLSHEEEEAMMEYILQDEDKPEFDDYWEEYIFNLPEIDDIIYYLNECYGLNDEDNDRIAGAKEWYPDTVDLLNNPDADGFYEDEGRITPRKGEYDDESANSDEIIFAPD